MISQIDIRRLEAMPIEGVAERLGLRVERHKALCPFHDDTHPSLTFDTYRNRFRCFVCDAHGGVIDLVMRVKGRTFREACEWLEGPSSCIMRGELRPKKKRQEQPLDLEWLEALIRTKVLVEPARRFLFEERHIDPRVVEWCGLTSIMQPQPCWRYGKPFYDAPSLLIPYYDLDGRLRSVQSRYLGGNGTADSAGQTDKKNGEEKPRFRFPRGSNCHIYNLPVLKLLKPGEPLWIAEGCSDCWALLSSGRKAIAIPSATLLRDDDLSALTTLHSQLSTTFHIYPDQDRPGEQLFLQLRERLPQLERHQLPAGYKDFGAWWASRFLNM